MNRPNINDYLLVPNVCASVTRGYYYDLEKYCDELEMQCLKLEQRLRTIGIDINPCDGCTDYCYKNDTCKSNGGCGNAR